LRRSAIHWQAASLRKSAQRIVEELSPDEATAESIMFAAVY